MAENWDLGRGPPNIISSGCLEMVGLFKHHDLGTTLANTCFYPRTAVPHAYV